jgi:glycosyltransferase involved in cell wall biosynthesis
MPRTGSESKKIGDKVRVAHLVSHPVQYFAPLYAELASRPELDLVVFFFSDLTAREYHDPGFGRNLSWDRPLLEGYKWKTYSRVRPRIRESVKSVPNWSLVKEVTSGSYDVVWVHGYANPTSLAALIASAAKRIPYLVRDEQTLIHRRRLHRRLLRAALLRPVFSAGAGLYIGKANKQFFLHYGMKEKRLFSAPYSVDNAYFSQRALQLASDRESIRSRFGIADEAPVILFSGKFIDKKQPLLLIEAFKAVRDRHNCWLLLVGDGPLRRSIEAYASENGVPSVLLPGFLNQTELPAAYVAADIFVLPSNLNETWGLVVNEAMNFSLPIIVSDKVGCGADLVKPGRNGFVFPSGDARLLIEAIETLVKDDELRRAFGHQSRAIIESYAITDTADGIVNACLAITRGRSAV